MSGSVVAMVIFLIILVILIAFEIVGIILYKNGLDACKYKQSPYCYALSCSTASGPCGADASRCENGKLYCSLNPFNSVGTC